ncbi:uncharacterized protein I206_106367 [Kwoniella pini CBS 10737]|uniref:Uncharacterized protein n=1 Tax=Kwoniella pini CBS 10737 TaxID=1296096 RepID=A0A1B9HU37_9TREE|nr:uncharacterized protein I206_07170 [Kwoniella pini CBS 10737]OCF46783.1 hypothetical protein I206_07170 [Kwoniella pini CBS 10737]
MPRATVRKSRQQPRRSLRYASNTQVESQSQPENKSDVSNEASWLDSQTQGTQTQVENSFLSISTASLPSQYSINIALSKNVKLSTNDERGYQVKGEEALSDAWYKPSDNIGHLKDIRQSDERRIKLPNDALDTQKRSKGHSETSPLWYSAGMKITCVCSLPLLRNSYSFCSSAPVSTSLYPLSSAEEQVATDVTEIPEWYVGDEMIDLDPSMDAIPDFEYTWNIEQHQTQSSNPDTTVCENSQEVYPDKDKNRLRKGKYKAIEKLSFPVQTYNPNSIEVDRDPIRVDVVLPPSQEGSDLNNQEKNAWQEEAKRRKAYWRNLMKKDAGYGKLWEILPLPYSHPSRYLPHSKKRKKTIIPPYQLPRTYTSLPHPFHPDFLQYIKSQSSARVYWLIPIHGPVYIPLLNHPLTKSIYEGQVIPSEGIFLDSINVTKQQDKSNMKLIQWTSELLLNFLESFLHPLYMNENRPFGIIGYSFSGAKPDPYIDLPVPSPLAFHAGYKVSKQDQNQVDISLENITVEANKSEINVKEYKEVIRPEVGDHLRIYLSLKFALQLRTWLHNIKIPITSSSEIVNKDNPEGENTININAIEDSNIRMFYKTRLTLIGERGEVLIVA